MPEPTLKIEADHFWSLLSESRLLGTLELESLRDKFYPRVTADSDAENSVEINAVKIAKDLVGEKAITPLQARVLLAGHAGPFLFGRYQLMASTPAEDVFLAVDRTTRHPVWLHFFPGQSAEDLERWNRIEACCQKMEELTGHNPVRIYEAVATPEYRFVVTGMPAGQPLVSKLPEKSKLAPRQAGWIGLQVARGIENLDGKGLGCPDDLMSALWISKVGTEDKVRQQVQLWASPVATETASPEDNGRKLAQLQWRLLTGRPAPPAAGSSKAELATALQAKVKDQLPDLLCESISSCLVGKSDLPKLIAVLEDQIGDKEVNLEFDVSGKREEAFVESLVPWEKSIDLPDVVPDLEPVTARADSSGSAVRPKPGMSKSAALALSLFGFAALIGLGAFLATLQTVETRPTSVADNGTGDGESGDAESVAESNANKLVELETLRQSASYVQDFVEDDSQTLWESPTTGFPVSNQFMPRAPRIIAILDWQGIRKSESGQKAILSLGPGVTVSLAEMERLVAVPRAKWKSSTITWHTNDQLQYEWCVHVELVEAESVAELLTNVEKVVGRDSVYESRTRHCWWITELDQDNVKSFLFGPSSLVKGAEAGELAALTGPMKRLAEQSDSNRHVTLLSTSAALFNSEAQELMGDRLRPFIREFRARLPASVQGILLSLHFDQGDYLEMRLDHSADVKPNEMVSIARDRVRDDLVELTDGFDQLNALSYWEPVRKRYSAMVREVANNARWDAEFGNVIGNVWLRPGAVHNLVAATELAVSFPATTQQQVATEAVPQSIEELLATRRDLLVANPPDLNVLLREISEEVSGQYLDLPFEFKIQISGSDLQKEGITQNQRPAAMNIKDQSLAEILTQVMVAANPNRNISGPSDQNCKLVWVVVEDDSKAGQKLVLVTTRSAALENGYELPSPFVGQSQN